MTDSLGDRIKAYEFVNRNYLCRKVPVIIRVDGKCFSNFPKKLNKPFDKNFINCMVEAAKKTAEQIQCFKLCYVQSDEATFLLTDYDDINTQGWFDYNISKLISISAAYMSVFFNSEYREYNSDFCHNVVFDSRVFNIPKEDVANSFLWRMKDYERNSIFMYARSLFSHKELYNKKREDIHEMLHNIGKNWTTDLTDQEKNGTFIINTKENGIVEDCSILPKYEYIEKILREFI